MKLHVYWPLVAVLLIASCAGLGAWLQAPAGSPPPTPIPAASGAQGAPGRVTFALPGGGELSLPGAAPATPITLDVPGFGAVMLMPSTATGGSPVVSSGDAAPPSSGGSAVPPSPPPPAASAPAPAATAPTNGDAVAQGVGGVVSAITGNGLFGVLAAAAATALLGGRKAKPVPTPTV